MRGPGGWAGVALLVVILVLLPLAGASPSDPQCAVITTGTHGEGIPTVTPIIGESEYGAVVQGNVTGTGFFVSLVIHPSACTQSPASPPGLPSIPELP